MANKNNKDYIFNKLKRDQEYLENDEEIIEEDANEVEKSSKITFRFITIMVFLILVVIFGTISFFLPKIELKNDKTIILNYKDKYKESGYNLIINGKKSTKNVIVSGKVNSNVLGKYNIIYTYKYLFFKITKKRTVYVKDLTKPVIILNGSKDEYICPGSEYKDDGFSAIDNYDKDITKKVDVVKSENYYTYSVKDSSGNFTSIRRNITKKDIVKPFIKLDSDLPINIFVGDTYNEATYSASDNCDGDITNKVVISSEVDTNNIGSYTVKYSVKDSGGNEVEKTRVVNVIKKTPFGTIYLTFDDGPRLGTTDRALDILKEEGIHATFFVTNNGPDSLIKRAYDEGNSIGLHTASHNYSYIYSSVSNYFSDLDVVGDRVYRITGNKSNIIRFPGGSSNTISKKYHEGIMSSLTNEVLKRGYKYYDWNISSGDAGNTTSSDGVYKNVIKGLSHNKINIVLMHDIKSYTVDSLKKIIIYAKENGYTFDVINSDTEMVHQKVFN